MKEPVRVLHFTATAGDSDYFRTLVTGLDRSRFDVAFGTLQGEGPIHGLLRSAGIDAFALGAERRRAYPAAVFRLARRLRHGRIDVLHAHLYDGCVVGLAAATLARVALRVFTAHHVVDSLLHLRFRDKRAAFTLDAMVARYLIDQAIAPSAHTEEVLREAYGVSSHRIVRIPYGFSIPQPVDRAARDRVRSELGIEGSVAFAAVGRLHWVKGLPTLYRAFAAARARLRRATLLIVGAGPELPSLEKIAVELGIDDAVVYTGHRSDVGDILGAVDVFVNSSLGEAFNQAMMEALSAGLFVVATDVGAAAELLADESVGLIVPPGDAAALAVALCRAAELYQSNPDRRRAVVSRYTIGRMISAHESLYGRAVAGATTARQ